MVGRKTVTLRVIGGTLIAGFAGFGQVWSMEVPFSPPTPILSGAVQDSTVSLRVTGAISHPAGVSLGLQDLEAFAANFGFCYCPWTGADNDYRGALLLPLLNSLGMDEGASSVELRGDNGYRVRIRMEDLKRHRYMVAFEMDGELLSRRKDLNERGPLVVVVEFAEGADVDMEVYKFQFVWQLTEIRVI